MPQDSESGRRGFENGLRNAELIAQQIGAVRLRRGCNEFRLGDRIVLIKTGTSIIATRSSLERVQVVIYGIPGDNNRWNLYEMAPRIFENLSVASQSRNHDESYRLVRRTQFVESGRRLN